MAAQPPFILGAGADPAALIAVIVGIDGYEGLQSLHCAVNDAVYLDETLRKTWKDHTVDITTLIRPSLNEEQAKTQREAWGTELPEGAAGVGRERILAAVRDSAAKAGEADTFVFYFSGHGELVDDEPALMVSGDGDNAEKTVRLRVSDIQQAAAHCVSRNRVMILDCCQRPARRYQPVEGYKHVKELTRGWSILLSSSPGEVSLEDRAFGDERDDYLQQGIFTASLVEGLRGEAASGDDSVSLADLAYFVGKRVPVEYLERITAKCEFNDGKGGEDGEDERGGWGADLYSQNPVLLSDAVAMNGPYKITMAPVLAPTSHGLRKKLPTRRLLEYWFKFLFAPWPIRFPFKTAFLLTAFLYAAGMTMAVIWHAPAVIDNTMRLFFAGVGVGSALLWWFMLPFSAAVNEDRWHAGGYVTHLFYLVWHCIIVLVFARVCGVDLGADQEAGRFFFLVSDLFFIWAGIVIFGVNPAQSIIALAEPIRNDDRREIRQAIRAFQQFKFRRVGVDLYNFLAAVSVRPDVYLIGWGISVLIIAFNIYQVGAILEVVTVRLWVLTVRNIVFLVMVTWLVYWYQAAFKYIQREVYRR